MPARTGAELLRGLKDGRQIWVGDDKVTDVVSHPAFSGRRQGRGGLRPAIRGGRRIACFLIRKRAS